MPDLPPSPARPSKYDLYERCVQSPKASAAYLRAIHGRSPRVLREDFCGGGALCLAWVATDPLASAIGVDLDSEPLARLSGVPRVRAVAANVLDVNTRADLIAATNFPLGYFDRRSDLVEYLRRTRSRLKRGGVFAADMYGGRDSMTLQTTSARFILADGTPVLYEWEHREADPVSARVVNVIHFTLGKGKRAVRLHDAFTYVWRLWSIPELTDAYREAGFAKVEVYDHEAGALDHLGTLHVRPYQPGADTLPENWVVFVVGRA
ncbi:MAG: class I SAM-dependent methyltransferase [Leptolyngbya sp. PLA1]|nr:class I SAM-dependent methyltransferase [Leptolyngbya sp. PLA1]